MKKQQPLDKEELYEEFKKDLASSIEGRSEEEVRRFFEKTYQFGNALVDHWFKNRDECIKQMEDFEKRQKDQVE